jgi:hypothetical protein
LFFGLRELLASTGRRHTGRKSYHFTATQDVEFGGFELAKAAGGEPDITGEFCLLLLAKEYDYKNLSLHSFVDN